MLPFLEPQLLGGVGHGLPLEDTIVAHKACEAVGVPFEPVHHEPSVGRPRRTDSPGIDEIILP